MARQPPRPTVRALARWRVHGCGHPIGDDVKRTAEPVKLDFETDSGFGSRARIGLIVLETDQTIEAEVRQIRLVGVDWYHSRIPMESKVTPSTLTAMEERLPVAAALLPAEFAFDAIGYGCTSAATLIGEAGVTAGIQVAHPGVACSNPITAAIAAFNALGAHRIAVVTPYTAEVTAPVIDLFVKAGFEVSAVGSFIESSDLVVARITEASVASAVRQIVAVDECDAVFVSCTSLRTFGIIAPLEAELGKAVVSSNLALIWHLLRLAGVEDTMDGLGTLLQYEPVRDHRDALPQAR